MNIFDLTKPKDNFDKKTRFSLILSTILKEPLFSMYNLTAFILRKDLNASVFLISLLTMLRPMVSIFSYYYSYYGSIRLKSLKQNFIIANFLSIVLFFILPFYNSAIFLIIAASVYIMFYRAASPSWLEMIKINIDKKNREKLFSFSSTIGYIEGIILAFILGFFLKKNSSSYKSLYFITAIFSLINIFLIKKIPIKKNENRKEKVNFNILTPLKEGVDLLKKDKNFNLFQIGFMISGFALMLVQPIIPILAVDTLKLSHQEFAIAILVCRGLGYIMSSPIWGRAFSKVSILKLSSYMFLNTFIFMIFLSFSKFNILFFYLAYVVYGITQAGSHLIWNMSGPIFSKNEDSSKYSAINVLMVAIRGSVAPMLGSILIFKFSIINILILASILCLYSSYVVFKRKILIFSKSN
jgi:predicted MFS family arabinose efflux permease